MILNNPTQFSSFHRVRAAVLIGFKEAARFVGLDPLEQLRRSGITTAEIADPENWLAAKPVADLLERCARESGRSDFTILMAECRSFSSLGPLSLLLKHEATLRQIIVQIGNFKRQLNDIFDVHLQEFDEVAVLQWTIPAEYASSQIVALVSAMGYRALRESTGGTWIPETVHFPFSRPSNVSTFERYFATGLEFGSDFCGFSFPSRDLDAANPLADAALARHAASLLELAPAPPESLADQARHVLLLLLPSGKATLRDVARNLGTEPRTLQRGLEASGKPFTRILAETRRALATLYLSNPRRSISEVASLTGYSTVSAFSRWFTHEFGVSPAAWRRLRSH